VLTSCDTLGDGSYWLEDAGAKVTVASPPNILPLIDVTAAAFDAVFYPAGRGPL
jgi:hypothetical protein